MAAHVVQGRMINDLSTTTTAYGSADNVVEMEVVVSSFHSQRSREPARNVHRADEWADPLQLLRLFRFVLLLTYRDRLFTLSR